MENEPILSGEELVDLDFQGLLNDYMSSNHRRKVDVIQRAYDFACEAHKGVKRRSGEPYIMHPVAVARIVCRDMGLGSTSIAAALLHDVVEDTDYTEEHLEGLFGQKIAQIVGGLTKISGGVFGEHASEQSENFRKLLLTMSKDIRVILIKIADRLHNMRTLSSMLPAKQFKIAGETLYIYAPMAHRLGLFAIKTELEDLSFKYEDPDTYGDIVQRIERSRKLRDALYEHFSEPILPRIDNLGISYEMKARVKSPYSIWNKMQTKHIPFEEVFDLFAVRIIFDTPEGGDEKSICWDIYSRITDVYLIRPDRIRDWVSRPKPQGYQALHLTVMGPDGQWIEVQIRSRRMDDIAERGFAAHWKYKEGNVEEDSELDKWISTIQEVLEHPSPNAIDFMETIKMNLFASEIFVFTPKGEIKTLPQDATIIDFAYLLHTNLGDQCIGAKVNHHLVPLSYKLQGGDQVELITSRAQTPKAEWLNFASTSKARTKIDLALKKERRKMIQKGEKLLLEALERSKMENDQATRQRVVSFYNFQRPEDFLFFVGSGEIVLPEDLKRAHNQFSLVNYFKGAIGLGNKDREATPKQINVDKKRTFVLRPNEIDKSYVLAKCCAPIHGDTVLGFVENDKVTVHKRDCSFAAKLKSSFGERIVSVAWENSSNTSFIAAIGVDGIDRAGMLSEITQVMAESRLEVQAIHLECKDGIYKGEIRMIVRSVSEIQLLCANIKRIKGVQGVYRLAK